MLPNSWLYHRLKDDLLFRALIKMFIESYLAASISCLIAFYNVSFSSTSEIAQAVMAILIFLMLLALPAILILLA